MSDICFVVCDDYFADKDSAAEAALERSDGEPTTFAEHEAIPLVVPAPSPDIDGILDYIYEQYGEEIADQPGWDTLHQDREVKVLWLAIWDRLLDLTGATEYRADGPKLATVRVWLDDDGVRTERIEERDDE